MVTGGQRSKVRGSKFIGSKEKMVKGSKGQRVKGQRFKSERVKGQRVKSKEVKGQGVKSERVKGQTV